MIKKTLVTVVLGVLVVCIGSISAGRLSPIEQLGKILFQDKNLSLNATQSCQTCHHHASGFADPTNSRDPYYSVVSIGDDGFSKGGRNAPSAAYAGYSPILHEAEDGNYYGGMFWDGRATGAELGDPLAEQAKGPPLNPVEMNMPSKAAVVQIVQDSSYAPLFQLVFGQDAFLDVDTAYDNIAGAIAAYERSHEVQKFSSRFDRGLLSEKEFRGLTYFEDHCGLFIGVDRSSGNAIDLSSPRSVCL